MPRTRGTGSSTDAPVRRTFLISDIRGYSTFTRERGDEVAARLAKKFADLARDAVEARGGRVIELRGDEALAVFSDTAQAVRAAIEFQESCVEETALDPLLPLPVGVGIDAGEAIPVEDGYRGVALNMAARLCSKAAAGEVLVTRAVTEIVRGESLRFEERGPAELKGFDRPVDLFVGVAPGDVLPAPKSVVVEAMIPAELDAITLMVDREHELRWLRGTWRQVRRGRGRVVFVSGVGGIGKTRLAAELAAQCGGGVRYVGGGGAGGAQALAAIAEARATDRPTLLVLDDVSLYGDSVAALAAAAEEIESRPVLVIGAFRDAEGRPALAELIRRVDARGDGHRVLAALDEAGVRDIARIYVGEDVADAPIESMLRASHGIPARVHEVVSEWARDEAKRRLAAAAEWLTQGKAKQTAGLDFANNVIALKLERIYGGVAGERTDVCPYKGLAPFEGSDAACFYGRERLVGELAARTVGFGLLGVVGPSGSGKSSVVKAGLLPSLASGLLPGSERWGQASMRPGAHPVDEIERTLLSAGPGRRLVLVIDQFEEVFTTTAEESERTAFIDRVVELASEEERFAVVLTIRGDYYDRCAPYPGLADFLETNHVLVGPMTQEEVRRAIELPARHVGLRVESALTDALVEDVAEEPGGLPLLSTALVELWQVRDGGWLRSETFERTGGVRGAVARLADSTYEQLSDAQRDVARIVLLRLVGEGEGDAAVRRRVPLAEFDAEPDVDAVLSRLTQDRLLTRDEGQIEIAHEALIREWPRLRGWLEEDATGRQLRGHVTQSAKQWNARGRDDAELYRGARLSATLDWSQIHGRELNDLERDFLDRSGQASVREADKQRRTNRRLRGLLAGTALFLVVALLAGALALVQRGHARTAQTSAQAEALTSDAERIGTQALAETNLDRSVLLAMAGVKLQSRPETRGDLLAALQKSPAAIRLMRPTTSPIIGLAVSPDGGTMASIDRKGTVRLLDLRTWKQVGAPIAFDAPPSFRTLSFSPDGASLLVVIQGTQPHLTVVDVATRTQRSLLTFGSSTWLSAASYSPDGRTIAAGFNDTTSSSPTPTAERLALIDSSSGRVIWKHPYPLKPRQNGVTLGFTPAGALVTSTQQGDTYTWNARTGSIVRRFPIGGPLALSPNGDVAALAQNNADQANPSSGMALLDLGSGTQRTLQAVPTSTWISALKFTPDGSHVMGASFDDAVRVWDAASGAINDTFTGQAGEEFDAVVTPDGRTVLSAAADGSVMAWDLSGASRLGRRFEWTIPANGGRSGVGIVVNRQSSSIATYQYDGKTRLIDARTLRPTATLPAMTGSWETGEDFFPDGRTLVTSGINGRVVFWDLRTRRPTRMLNLVDPVWGVAVSPDGKLLLSQRQADGTLTSFTEVRDIATGAVLHRYQGTDTGWAGFSPDGREFAARGCCTKTSTVTVWDTRTGKELFAPRVPGDPATAAFSADSRLFSVGTQDGKLVFFDSRTGRQVGSPLQVSGSIVGQVSFSPDGDLFAVSAYDQTLSLWDLRTRKRLTNFPLVFGYIPAAIFTPKGDLLISYSGYGYLWPTSLSTWERNACQVAGRDLSPAEWHDLLPTRPYQHICPQ